MFNMRNSNKITNSSCEAVKVQCKLSFTNLHSLINPGPYRRDASTQIEYRSVSFLRRQREGLARISTSEVRIPTEIARACI